MNYKNYFIKGIAFIALIFITFSCNNDDNNKPEVSEMTPTEARQFVKESLNNFTNCIDNYNKGAFADFFYNYLTNDDGQKINTPPFIVYPANGKTEWISDVFDVWEKQYGYFININKPFDLNNKKGTYTWDKTTHKFKKQANSSNFVMLFPSDRSESNLDMKLEVDKYIDQTFSLPNETQYLPSAFHFTFYDKDKKVIECTTNNINFDVKSNILIPTSGNIVLYTSPVTHTIKLQRETPTMFYISEAFTQEGGCSTMIKGKIELKHSDYSNLNFSNSKTDIKLIDLELTHNDFSVKVNVNGAELSKVDKSLDKLTDTEFKQVIKAELFKQNKKVGDLILRDLQKDQMKTIVVLSDGSEIDLSKNFTDSLDRLKEILKRFID